MYVYLFDAQFFDSIFIKINVSFDNGIFFKDLIRTIF